MGFGEIGVKVFWVGVGDAPLRVPHIFDVQLNGTERAGARSLQRRFL